MAQFSLVHRTRPATPGGEPHPCLILLHGLGSNETDLYMLATQIDPRIFAVSARAPFPHPWGGHMWYDLEEGPGLGGDSIQRSLGLLESFLEEVSASYPVDPAQLFIGGFSMGAAMAGALTLLHPERIPGAIMLSGYLPPCSSETGYRAQDAAGHSFFQAHGTMDTVVSIDYARQTRDFLRTTPVDLTYREYPIGHEVSLEELSDLAAWIGRVILREPGSISR